MSTWFYMNGPERVGPVSQDQMCELFRKGVLGVQTLVWSDKFSNWTPASSIAALRSLSPSVPNTVGTPGFAAPTTARRPLTTLDYEAPAADGPVGIGGWLILPAIGMVLSPIGVGLGALGLLVIASKLQSTGMTGAADSLRMLAAINGLYALYILYTAIMFFAKKRSTPALVIGAYIGSIVLAVVAGLMTQSIPQSPAPPPGSEWLGVVKPVIVALIWVPYFRLSRRVQNTFVN
ncbi:MAG: DUF2569 family protein [Anaerolineae bacterium]|nr:DUF2569 family protein [Phycisphaerae bacterium]